MLEVGWALLRKEIRRAGALGRRGGHRRGGGSSANATASLVTSDDGAFGDGGEGGFVWSRCVFFLGRCAQIPAIFENLIPRPEEKKDIFTDTPIFDD